MGLSLEDAVREAITRLRACSIAAVVPTGITDRIANLLEEGLEHDPTD